MARRLFVLTLALIVGSVFLVRPGRDDEAASSGRTLIRDAALVLTMDATLGALENADVLIDGDRIAAPWAAACRRWTPV